MARHPLTQRHVRCSAACVRKAAAAGTEKPLVLQLDLNDEASVETFASTIAAQYPTSVRCHVNNAGFAFKNADPTPFEEQTAPTLRYTQTRLC